MKLVKENIEERYDDKVSQTFGDLVAYMRSKVFPKLSQDELIEFMEELKGWTERMLR
ncbi:MAG TPA: hypothetical protein VMW50_06315 [Dehalococcoidia bacterium]|nr:hypothetical protein [Dehalococcoidia bacterium]